MEMNKENYFTSENAIQKISEWKNLCDEIKQHKPFKFSPDNAALLIIDMQKVFLSPDSHAFIPSAPYILPNIRLLIGQFALKNLPIIFTRHITDVSPSNIMNKWWNDPIKVEEEKSEITTDLNTSNGIILQKHQYSGFRDTELDQMLRDKGVTKLVITGVLTHLCCETTVRDAFMQGYEVYFPFDASASYTESLHLGSLQAISHGFGICTSTKSLLSEMK